MTMASVQTITLNGTDVLPIKVETSIVPGLTNFIIVGLADKAVAESKERIRAALMAMGLGIPCQRLIVNLAPADVIKEGTHFDLPIALAILVALRVIPQDAVANYIAMGELGLDSRLHAVAGVLPAAMDTHARHMGFICPQTQGPEAAWAGSEDVLAPDSLISLINHFKGVQVLQPPTPTPPSTTTSYPDLYDVKGQDIAKRALEIAAAGGHNLLMIGPPGVGKSMLACRLVGLLPPMTSQEILEVSTIYSVASLLENGQLITNRPYRAPHHSASLPALVGGGSRAKPGELSLAHHGVLFLDELPEFSRQALESLRQPLENGEITIARVQSHVTYPARMQLVAAMNPCRCGYVADPQKACRRAPHCATDYQSKLSGPLLDRFDLFVDMPAISLSDLAERQGGETTAVVAARVAQARSRQQDRFKDHPDIRCNAHMGSGLLDQMVNLEEQAQSTLMQAAEKWGLSARSYHRLLKVARTIADLAQSETIQLPHVAEAISFRQPIYNQQRQVA